MITFCLLPSPFLLSPDREKYYSTIVFGVGELSLVVHCHYFLRGTAVGASCSRARYYFFLYTITRVGLPSFGSTSEKYSLRKSNQKRRSPSSAGQILNYFHLSSIA
ncbi:MAG: hypothetical protein F6K48_09705 [Okeania sp. SIO3H1]|nr:hypothetical protein [Okeania sp. SIO3H1]